MTFFSLFFDLFLILLGFALFFFGSVAFVVYIYCKIVQKPFKAVYPVALDKVINAVLKVLNGQVNGSQTAYNIDNSCIKPILKALNENGCSCVEKTAYFLSSVLHYEFVLSDRLIAENFDIDYFEKLIQAVFYAEVLPLYQVEPINKESVSVFLQKQANILLVYIGHSPEAYQKMNQYRNIAQQRKLETLNDADREMFD